MGGLRDQITEEDLRQYFGQFGIIERVETFTDKETNKRKGFCFITFQDFDSVDKCVCEFLDLVRLSLLSLVTVIISIVCRRALMSHWLSCSCFCKSENIDVFAID